MNVITGFQLGDIVAPLDKPWLRMTVTAIHPHSEQVERSNYHCFWFDELLTPNEIIKPSEQMMLISPHNGVEYKVSIKTQVKLMHCHQQSCPAMEVIGLLEKTHVICQWRDKNDKNHIKVFSLMAIRPIRSVPAEK